jgi:hypothetical protein
LFSKGIISLTNIDLNGSGVYPVAVDSYDSRLGPYNQSTAGTSGDVAVLTGSVNTGNHWIDGNMYLGQDVTLTIGPNGGITGTTNVNWKMQIFDASIPKTDDNGNTLPGIWPDAPSAKSGNTIVHTFTTSGYYSIRDTGDLVVYPGVEVTLDVKVLNYDMKKSNVTIYGSETNNSGMIVMYQEAGSVTLGGSGSGGAFNNPPQIASGRPQNFTYFGLPPVTSVTMAGGSDFIGIIYAPEAAMTLNGGGSAINLSGSFVVDGLTMNGHYLVHYDTSIAGYYWGYYVPSSWQEIVPP